MQIRKFRFAILICILLGGIALQFPLADGRRSEGVRWPGFDELFMVDGWTMSSEKVERMNGSTYASRSFRAPQGTSTTLTIIADQNAKVFGAGAEVPFLGNGYEVSPAPADIVPPGPNRQGLLAQRGDERWLVLYAYGERRGLLGNGLVGWSSAVMDGLLGHGNDYYKLFVMTPLAQQDSSATSSTVALADALFPRIAAWYAS
ncbi:MAG: exosortase-associated EpsI family protein [Chloroflexota bacterium]|nr:exosortase-associated EpsI family protein [Chloroflexota bacterium]